MIIFDKNTKNLEVPAGLGNLEVNIITGGTGTAGVSSLDGQKGDLTLKTINGNAILGEGDIRTSGSPEELITSAVTEANAYTDSAITSALTDYYTSGQTDNAISAATQNMVTSTYVNNIWVGTTIQYNQITTKDPNTLYFINDN